MVRTRKTSRAHDKGDLQPARKFTVEEVGFVLSLLADPFYSERKIVQLFFTQFGKEIGHSTVNQMRHVERYKPVISAIRDVVIRELSDIPIANSRVRMQYLEHAARRCMMECRLDLKVDKDGGEHWVVGQQPQFIPMIVKEARLEMGGTSGDGPSVAVQVNTKGNVNVTVAQVMREVADDARKLMPAVLRDSLAKVLEEIK